MNERSIEEAPRRGRLPAEVRSHILELHQQGTSVEEIAERLNRSAATVRKVVGESESALEETGRLEQSSGSPLKGDSARESALKVVELPLKRDEATESLVNREESTEISWEATEGLASIDEVIEFLAGMPEEAIEELLQLARLQREQRLLRSSLEMRLRDLKKAP